MEINQQFWQDQNVVVTGHTGFKGGWLSHWLTLLGAKVSGLALTPHTTPNFYTATNLAARMDSHIGDIRDMQCVADYIQQQRPSVVFHLAAQPIVKTGYAEPLETFQTNVLGTTNVLEACRQLQGPVVVVVITSDKCYENQEWAWSYRENDPLGGHDPYSASKACAELVVSAYQRSFFSQEKAFVKHLATARAGNVIGGGDWSLHRIVPDIIASVAQNQPLVLRNPAATRPWQHVLEPLGGYLMLAEALATQGSALTGAWNFGPEYDSIKPVSWIAEQTLQHFDNALPWQQDAAFHPHEANLLSLDSAKAKSKLGWQPLFSLPQTLEMVTDWYKAAAQSQDLAALTTQQINMYMDAAKAV